MTTSITIGGRRIGPGEPVYVVAEMASNHNRSLAEAMRILGAAKQSGADAVKLGAAIPGDWLPELRELAGDLELDLFQSAGDDFHSSGDDPGRLAGDLPAYEISASAAADPALLRRVAAAGRPIILSTGTGRVPDALEVAVAAARGAGCALLAVLWRPDGCPPAAKDLQLRAIPQLASAFALPVGFGDHTLGHAATVAAVALGAAVVEKHLTLSRSLPVAESAISLEPEEFAQMTAAIRIAEAALGDRIGAGAEDQGQAAKA